MSILFRKSNAANASELRIMNKQWKELEAQRNAAEAGHGSLMKLLDIVADNDKDFAESELYKAANAARSPAEAYREFDSTTKIDMVPAGEHATLTRLMQVARSVDLGRQVFEYRKSTRAGNAKTSMSGQTGIVLDHVEYKYAGTIIPVHDVAFGISWRDALAMKAEGFDSLNDDSREAERSLYDKMDDYMWNGSDITVKGNGWNGIKGDASVAQSTLTVDLTSAAATAEDIRNEFRKQRDVLYIDNNCTKPLKVGVSREIMSNLERVFSTAEGVFGTIEDMVKKLRGIEEIYEDSALVGNEIVMYWADQQGFHPVVGMAISTYAVERKMHNDDFNYVKWAAVGFLAKTDAENRKCALYATSA